MTASPQIGVDPELSERLHGLKSRLEICDPLGKSLGVFEPSIRHEAPRDLAAEVVQNALLNRGFVRRHESH